MRQLSPCRTLLGTGILCLSIVLSLAERVLAEDSVALQVGSFMVAPAHLPPVIISVKNQGPTAYEGTIRVKLPDGWKYAPAEQSISLSPGETGKEASRPADRAPLAARGDAHACRAPNQGHLHGRNLRGDLDRRAPRSSDPACFADELR